MIFFLVNDGYLKRYARNSRPQPPFIVQIATFPPLMHTVIVVLL